MISYILNHIQCILNHNHKELNRFPTGGKRARDQHFGQMILIQGKKDTVTDIQYLAGACMHFQL